jgi:hypothetical protein
LLTTPSRPGEFHPEPLPGRAVARTGLRMMPTFPPLPLKSRTVSFPQYGFKAGISDSAFPSTTWYSRRMVCFHPSCTSLPVTSYPGSESGNAVRWSTTVQRPLPLDPRGPRSGLSYVVSVHHHLIGPMRPTRRHIAISPQSGLYAMPSLCVRTATSRRPTSGSVLSLAVLCRHVALRDPEKPVGCFYPVPSPTAQAFDYL